MTLAATLKAKLEAALAPERLEVTDESGLHVGHEGHRPGGETHFRIKVTSAAFAGLTRRERHARVHAVLAEELALRIHALALTLRAPGEEP